MVETPPVEESDVRSVGLAKSTIASIGKTRAKLELIKADESDEGKRELINEILDKSARIKKQCEAAGLAIGFLFVYCKLLWAVVVTPLTSEEAAELQAFKDLFPGNQEYYIAFIISIFIPMLAGTAAGKLVGRALERYYLESGMTAYSSITKG